MEELKDSGAMPRHGCVPSPWCCTETVVVDFHLYLKEIEFRFNYRNENLYPILTKMLVKAASDL
ncbi:hypothetical protein Ngar_c05940 [Candidatus Nitrososphaera gargensis Ga9.2]|uniref:Uncharacterized protein n=1 Tax=Nitrososphaera gargensis (strain Ga9.2) TaxID=1237085 RepID=K0IHY5_NITGG|nr:hypothetical protein Ngar_c05940 [Candidatus Nitrososphaera gargensis Ga9.2]